MQEKIITLLDVSLSENGFTLDELVYRIYELFVQKGYTEILKQIILLVEENFKLKIMQGKPIPLKCSCGSTHYVLNGSTPRKIMTSLGELDFASLSRVRCKKCGRTYSLIMSYLGVEAYQSKTSEAEKIALTKATGDTYRRATEELHHLTGMRISHTTLWRWMLKTQADEIQVNPEVVGSIPGEIFADGTKCKAKDEKGKATQGDIKVLIGTNSAGETFPIGTWTHGESWEQINTQLKEREVKFPEGTMLVCDGEPGLAEALAEQATLHQRCHWHIIHDTYHAMWQDGAKAKDSRPVQKTLSQILGIELPKEDFEQVSESEKDEIEKRMETSEYDIAKLIVCLRDKGYQTVANYLERAQGYMFNYVKRWLKFGISSPRASSLIERTMRALGRRVKAIAYNWKPDGLGKVVKLLLKIFSSPEQWEQYWNQRLKLNLSVLLHFKILKLGSDELHYYANLSPSIP